MKFLNVLNFINVLLLIVAFLSVVHVDHDRARQSKTAAVEESFNMLAMLVNARAELVRCNGLGAIPVDDQIAWESMDWFCVNVKTEEFSTVPRFEPLRSRVRDSLQDGYSGPMIKNSTDQFHLVVNTGDPVVGQFPDYRGTPVVSASELVTLDDGSIHAVFVEIDLAEVVKMATLDYRYELIVGICVMLSLIVMVFIRIKFKRLHRINYEFEIETAEVIKRMEDLGNENELLRSKR